MGRTMIAAVMATGLLSGCSVAESEIESPVECVERWADRVDPLSRVAGGDPSLTLFPTYTYDVSAMDPIALRRRIGAGEPFDPAKPQAKMIIAIGGGQSSYDDWLARKVGEAGAYFESGEVQVLRERGQPVPVSELTAQGCAKSAENLRLIRIDFDFRGFADGDNAPSQSGSITNTSSPQE